MNLRQADLFAHVTAAYADRGEPLSNADLYREVAERAGVSLEDLDRKTPVGRSQAPCALGKRAIRWAQQTLKVMGVLERVEDARGVWGLSRRAGDLNRASEGTVLVAFSTNLGVAVWGDCRTVFNGLDEEIHLCVTSPPYPLAKPRAYGNPRADDYVDFLCGAIEPIVRRLVRGGSICINLSPDIFEPGSPARSLYLERVTLALCDRFNLSVMDRLVWANPSRPPGPVRYASMDRVQLNATWETVLWLTNDPSCVRSDNRRVLLAHTDQHRRLIAAGGEARATCYGDGAHRLRQGSFGRPTEGRIPRNVLTMGHVCSYGREVRLHADRLGLPAHGASFPLSLPDFLIRFLSVEGDLVVDPFAGWLKTARAAERLRRRWLVAELMLDYLRPPAEVFRSEEGFRIHQGFEAWPAAA
jgi:site-specific DNA-methyltransferase (cytosine-N4-specific)